MVALNLLRKLLHSIEDPHCVPVLLMASRICGEQPNLVEEGINFAHRSLESLDNECSELEGIANLLLGVAHSTHSKSAVPILRGLPDGLRHFRPWKRPGILQA